MMRRLLLSAAVLASLGVVMAQAPRSAPDTYTRDDLKRVEQARDEAMERLKRLETQGRRAERESADIDRDLLAAAADSQRREEQAATAEARIADYSAQADAARVRLIGDRAALDDLLAALMTFGSHRPPALAASPDDAGRAIRAAILMGDAAPALSARAKDLTARIETLNRLVVDVRREKAALAAADQALAARREEIDALAEEKRLARVSLDAETATLRAKTERLGRQAETLHDLLDRLAASAPSAPSTKPSAGGAAKSAAKPPAKPPAALPVARSAATPVPPAVGRRIRHFGQKTAASPGLVLATRPAAQVVAPLDARVEYAGPFRSYGKMLILDVGGDILVVVSGLDALYPEAGQWVLAGEPIGRMADRKSPSPELYLEVRRNGQPVDPEKWLGRGA